MASHASKTLIGGFVVGAVALAIAGITAIGSGKLFHSRPTFVMFFSGSITGLSVGSPVEFRGVKVGEVTKIAAVFDPRDVSITIPVYVEFDPKSLVASGQGSDEDWRFLDATRGSKYFQPLLDKGLKAQLDMLSLVTKQLYINLDFHPDVPAKLVGLDSRYPEIPTIPSLQEQIVQTMQKLPEKIMSATDGIDRLVNSPATQATIQDLAVAIRDLDGLVRDVRSEVKPLATSLRATSDAAQRTFAQAERTLALKEGPAAELAASMKGTLQKADASLDQMRSTLDSYQKLAVQNSGVGYDLTKTLGDLDAAARSIQSLAEYLELHPESVLAGRR